MRSGVQETAQALSIPPESGKNQVGRRIVYLQYTNPAGYPPLQHSSRLLADIGCHVLFLGTGSFGTERLKLPLHLRITVRQLAFSAGGWKGKLHYLGFCFWALIHTQRWRAEWIYASDVLSCLPALLMVHLLGVKLLYHEHDHPVCPQNASKHARGPRVSSFLKMCLWSRRHCANLAQVVVLPSEGRAALLAADTGLRNTIRVVWNCPSLGDIPAARDPDYLGPLRLIYAGSVVEQRLPLSILEGMALTRRSATLDVLGYETVGARGYFDCLRKRARELGIQDHVRMAGTVQRAEMMKICARAHVGISLVLSSSDDPNLRTLPGASNKTFDYLACGLGILVPDSEEWRDLFVSRGYGIACNPSDPNSIATALSWFCDHPEERARMGERGRKRIQSEWNYQAQFKAVLNEIIAY